MLRAKQNDRRDAALLLVALLGLAAPFMPIPGDRPTRIAVAFQNTGMDEPARFTAHTTDNICHVLAAVLTFEDPNGGYTRIDCGWRDHAAALAGTE